MTTTSDTEAAMDAEDGEWWFLDPEGYHAAQQAGMSEEEKLRAENGQLRRVIAAMRERMVAMSEELGQYRFRHMYDDRRI